jgi:hypothetical protein
MIQPIVVDTNESMERASIQEGSETELGMKARDLKQKLKPTPTPSPKKKKFQLFQTPKIDNY